jgi:hypothetical protein
MSEHHQRRVGKILILHRADFAGTKSACKPADAYFLVKPFDAGGV